MHCTCYIYKYLLKTHFKDRQMMKSALLLGFFVGSVLTSGGYGGGGGGGGYGVGGHGGGGHGGKNIFKS